MMHKYSLIALAAQVLALLAPAGAFAQDALPPVSLNGHYFQRAGRPFIPAGVHWVPAKAAMHWPQEWDPASIEADFRKMHEMGVNTVRLDMVWAWFEPRPGDYNPAAFAQLDEFVKLARRYQIYLVPSLFIGNEVGEAIWDVPWRHGRHPHADPEMLRLETNHAAEFGRRYARETAIQSWDLTDEPPFWNAPRTTDAMAINWTRLIAGALRRFDKLHPIVVGTDAQEIGHGPFRAENIIDEVDYLSVHPYPAYNSSLYPDPLLSERTTYASAFQVALSGGAGKPVTVQEIGASSASQTPERIASYLRANLYSSLGAGANGFLLWCYTDAAPQSWERVPYRRAAHETQFGLTTWDGHDRPSGVEFRRFSRLLDRLDLNGVAPAPAEAGILVPFEWSKPYGDMRGLGLPQYGGVPYVSSSEPGSIAGQEAADYGEQAADLSASWLNTYVLARRAGLQVSFPREYGEWSKLPLVLVPAPLANSRPNLVHLHTTFWQRAKDYVRAGGTLYVSLSGDSAIPEMEELFGARLADRIPTGHVAIKFKERLGSIQPGDEFVFDAGGATGDWGALLDIHGGQVIATDQDGHPALVAHTLGRGKVLTSAYPIEKYVSHAASAYGAADVTHRLYQALAEWGGVQPLARTDRPEVEVSTLAAGGRGYLVLTNHSAAPQTVTVRLKNPLKQALQLTPEGSTPLTVQGREFKIGVGAYGGEIVDYREAAQ
jgi:endo-1,4-beta-mannosidase